MISLLLVGFYTMPLTIKEINAKRATGSRLIILARTKDSKVLICKCYCGVIFSVRYSNFIHGGTMSCGCARINTLKGKLTPIEEINKRKPKDSRWTALHYDTGKTIPHKIVARCSCGSIKKVRAYAVCSGESKSCGCYNKEVASKRNTKWTGDERVLKIRWNSMISRCYNPSSERYKSYGGRGVIVCKEWRYSPDRFIAWALSNGFRKDLQLDKDIKGNGLIYSPATCCFVTQSENAKHKRYNPRKKYIWENKLLGLKEICTLENVPYSTVAARLRKGNSLNKSINNGSQRTSG